MKTLLPSLTAAALLACVSCPPSAAQTPVPHSFQSIAITPDGAALLSLAGRPAALFRNYYDLYPIEHSANLLDWAPITTLLRTNSITNLLEFLDRNSAHQLTRFYRTPTNHFPTAYPTNIHDFSELASHGFIVASADHLDCGATLAPGGQVVDSGGDVSLDRKRYFENKVADLRLISDSLPGLNREDPILRERIDLEKKGAFGWSFGASATLKLCLDDPSFLAYASLDGAFGDVIFRQTNSLQRPLILMGNSSVLFVYATNSAYSLQLRNSEHRTFADPLPFAASPGATSRRVAQTIAGCLVSFFRKHLKNEDDTVLDDPAKVYPDVSDFRKK